MSQEMSSPSSAGRSTAPPGRGATALASAEWLLLLALIAVFVWRGFLPGWRTLSTDFPNYYLAARVYRQVFPLNSLHDYLAARVDRPGYPFHRLYDWTWVQRQKDHAGIEKRIIGYVPLTYLSALPMLPLSYLPPLEAKHTWLLINLLLLGLGIYLLSRMTSLGLRRVAILAFLTLDPLRTNFLYGQEHVFLLFLLILATWLYSRGWLATSGGTLALAAGFKIYPALFFLYFLRKRQWRALAGLAVGGVAIAGLSVLIFGFQANWAYVREVLPWPLRGEVNDPYSVHWNSATALLHRLFIAEPELNPYPLVMLPALYAFLQPLFQALLFVPVFWLIGPSRADAARERLEWGSFVFLLLILSTNPTSYHHCVMILTAVLVADYLRAAGSSRPLGVFVFLYALACLPFFRYLDRFDTSWKMLLAFPRLYAMLALWGFLVWRLARVPEGVRRFSLWTREGYAFAGLFLALAIGGWASNQRHLRGLYQNYASRVVVVPDSLYASEPAVAGDVLLYTAMQGHVYTTASLTGSALRLADFGADAFHPTAAAGSREAFVELAGTTSRIVRFPLSRTSFLAGQSEVVAENAEKPTVSPDGRWLLFIREDHGRGSLWVKDLHAEAAGGDSKPEWQWLGSDADVLEGTVFPDNSVVFATRPGGNWMLFSGQIPNHSGGFGRPGGRGAIRYPAASPDGKWLAYSMEEKGNWQLWVMRVEGRGEFTPAAVVPYRLTDAQCNSTHPAWLADSKTLVYATDCGRGLGLTALARIQAVP